MEQGRASAPSIRTSIRFLEKIARRDTNGRGLSNAPTGVLGPAAFDLLSGRRIIILTGFCIRSVLMGETDGPPGALALARALRGLGKEVLLVSDRFSLPLLRAGTAVTGSGFPMLELTGVKKDDDRLLDKVVATFKPTHVLAIERPGSAMDGHRYSMRGEILDDIAPAADRLFTEKNDRKYATIAIGDGGNELGMGPLRSLLKGSVSLGDRIFNVSPSDYTIAAGISNWGGYALSAALSLLSGILLLGTAKEESRIMEAIINAGAVDGCTKERRVSVDGLPWDMYIQTIQEIYDLTMRTLEKRKVTSKLGRTE